MEFLSCDFTENYGSGGGEHSKTPRDVKLFGVETPFEKMESLNLFMQKQLHQMDGILVKKQGKIQRLQEELQNERRLRQSLEQKLHDARSLIVFHKSEVENLLVNVKAGNFSNIEEDTDDDMHNCMKMIKELSTDVSQWFSNCTENNTRVRREVAGMQQALAKLLQKCGQPCANSATTPTPVVVTLDDSSSESSDDESSDSLEEGNRSPSPPSATAYSRNRIACRKCGRNFATRKTLFAHQKLAHGLRRGPPTPINQTGTGNGAYKLGKDGRLHGKDMSKMHLGIYCACGSKYSYKSSLYEHISIMTTEWRFPCTLCPQKFYRATYLRKHMLQAHNAQAPPTFGCRRCGKKYRSLAQVVRHRLVDHHHKNKLNGKCGMSNRTSTDQSSPPTLSPYFENVEVPAAQQQQQQQMSRSNEHAFAVPLTPYTSNSADPQRFFCTCSLSFTSRKHLASHIKAKMVGKIFKCVLCQKAYEFHANLKSHVEKAHKIPYTLGKFGCRDCGNTFHHYHDLMNHRISVHYLSTQE